MESTITLIYRGRYTSRHVSAASTQQMSDSCVLQAVKARVIDLGACDFTSCIESWAYRGVRPESVGQR